MAGNAGTAIARTVHCLTPPGHPPMRSCCAAVHVPGARRRRRRWSMLTRRLTKRSPTATIGLADAGACLAWPSRPGAPGHQRTGAAGRGGSRRPRPRTPDRVVPVAPPTPPGPPSACIAQGSGPKSERHPHRGLPSDPDHLPRRSSAPGARRPGVPDSSAPPTHTVVHNPYIPDVLRASRRR